MRWLVDPDLNEELSRVDMELTAQGFTATDGGRRLGVSVVALLGVGWLTVVAILVRWL